METKKRCLVAIVKIAVCTHTELSILRSQKASYTEDEKILPRFWGKDTFYPIGKRIQGFIWHILSIEKEPNERAVGLLLAYRADQRGRHSTPAPF